MTRANRSRAVFLALVSIIVVAFLVLVGFTVTNLATRLQASNDRNTSKDELLATKDDQIASLLGDVHASQENAQRLWDQLLSLGETPEGEDPQAVVGPAGERGPRGLDGEDGADATDAQVAQAIANWCLTFGCTGTAGRDGTNGRDGTDSTTPGPVGATGPAGPTGAPGPAGVDGRGIQSLLCDEITGRWTVTYTDTTTADAGVCLATTPETP